MSIIKTFVDAFKKASAPKDQGALEHARNDAGLGVSGPTDAFNPPAPPPGGTPGPNPAGPISGGQRLPDTAPINRPPSQPAPPNEPGDQGPIEGGGGGGGNPTPPSAPFDPNQIKFRQAAPGGTGPGAEDGGPTIGAVSKEMDGAAKDLESDDTLGNFEIQDISDKEPPPPPPPPPTPIQHGVAVPPQGFDKVETLGEIKGESADFLVVDPGKGGTAADNRAIVEGGDTPEFADEADVPSRRGPLVQVEPEGGDSGGGSQLDGNEHGTDSKGGEALRLDRDGSGSSGSYNPGRPEGTDQDGSYHPGRPEGDTGHDGSYNPGRPDGGSGGETARQMQNTGFGDKIAQGAGNVASSDPEEGGEVSQRSIGNPKYEDVKLTDDSGGGDELGSIAKGKAQPGEFNFTHTYDKASPVLARESSGDPFDIKVEQVLPSTPPGVPIPYPNVDSDAGLDMLGKEAREDRKIQRAYDDGDDDALREPDVLARPKGGGPVNKLQETFGDSSPEFSDEQDDGLGDALARKAGEGQKDFLKVTMKEAFISRTELDGVDGESMDKDHKGELDFARGRGGLSSEPPPNLPSEDHGVSDSLARKAGEGQKEFLDIKVHDVLVSSANEPSEPLDGPETDDDGLVDSLARKAGKGQQDYLVVKMQDVLVSSRQADDDGIDGESTTKDHKGDLSLARRTEVKDSHDRYANVESQAADDDFPDDDDFESSSLLDLKPTAASSEMLPGLAGELPDDADLDFDFDDGDADADTDESEL